MKLVLKNCKLAGEEGLRSILIEDRIIKQISTSFIDNSDSEIDAGGRYVLPGAIDCHVHFREPGMEQKEDWATASKAAAVGGVTTVLDMPNTKPPTLTAELLKQKQQLAKKSIVNYGFHFGSSKDNIEEIKKAKNIASVKVYMDHTTGNLLIEDIKVLEQIFQNTKIVTAHAEGENIKKAVELAKKYETKLYICHVSRKSDIEYLRENKTPNIFVEVTPHHLFLTEKDGFRMKPELGTEEDRQALWEALKQGIIDTVATDHAPHAKGEDAYGVPGVETMLPLLLNEVNKGNLTMEKVVELTSANPASIFGIKNKGKLEEGYDADIIIVDMSMETKVENNNLYTKCGWSPFNGKTLKGWPVTTIVSGEVVYHHHKINDIKAKGVEYNEV